MFCISQLVRGKRKKIQVLCYCNVSFFCHNYCSHNGYHLKPEACLPHIAYYFFTSGQLKIWRQSTAQVLRDNRPTTALYSTEQAKTTKQSINFRHHVIAHLI